MFFRAVDNVVYSFSVRLCTHFAAKFFFSSLCHAAPVEEIRYMHLGDFTEA